MEEDGCYNTEITLSDTLKNVPITAIRDGGTCEVTVNGTTFTFVDDGTMPTVDYPSGTPYAELLFYDLNSDGVVDFHIKTANGTSTPAAGAEKLIVGENLTFVIPSASGSTYNGESGFLTVHRNDVMERKWIEERDYFYPIPTKERVLTNGVLTQNPGWNDGLGL
jgi:hypothetical protein